MTRCISSKPKSHLQLLLHCCSMIWSLATLDAEGVWGSLGSKASRQGCFTTTKGAVWLPNCASIQKVCCCFRMNQSMFPLMFQVRKSTNDRSGSRTSTSTRKPKLAERCPKSPRRVLRRSALALNSILQNLDIHHDWLGFLLQLHPCQFCWIRKKLLAMTPSWDSILA